MWNVVMLLGLGVLADNECLLKQMGNDSFFLREIATQEMACRMDWKLYLALRERKFADPEVQGRVDCLVNHFESRLMLGWDVKLQTPGLWPQIDEGMPACYYLGGPWLGWTRQSFILYYLDRAAEVSSAHENYPHWTRYRLATKIWMCERINLAIADSLRESKSEAEFRFRMYIRMFFIQQDVDMLTRGDRAYVPCTQRLYGW